MGFFDELKKNISEKSPELLAKTTTMADKVKQLAEEAAVKAAPVIKDATSKAAAYAQEKSPIVQEKALKLIEEVKASHASHMEIAKTNHDAYTKAAQEREDAAAAYIRTMYQIDTTPESPAFIQERFHHDGKYLNFLCVTGEVLETEKRAEINFRSGHSVHASGGGFLWDWYRAHEHECF